DIEVRQTFIMPLHDDIETIFTHLNEDHRRNIRKAEKELSIANEPEMLQQLWGFQKATLDKKDVRMHFTQLQLQTIFDACMQHECTALWVARRDSEVQAILWHVWDGMNGYYLAGSNNPASRDSRAMTALLWHAIK